MLTWVYSDLGIPKDYRHMFGFGVHTFKWVNAAGKEVRAGRVPGLGAEGADHRPGRGDDAGL